MEGNSTMTSLIAIDIGNTRVKSAYFHQGQIVWLQHANVEDIESHISELIAQIPRAQKLIVSWINVNQEMNLGEWEGWNYFDSPPLFQPVGPNAPWPITNAYQTPQTLGTDRIVAAIGALQMVGEPPVLVIDIGTAITYDVINEQKAYLGGGISPGMHMRFRALHDFTARLPLVSPENNFSLIGNSTHDSIRSGVVNGVLAELDGIICRYKEELGAEIAVVLTGGDAHFFEKRLKSINFVEQNLVLWGLHTLLFNQI